MYFVESIFVEIHYNKKYTHIPVEKLEHKVSLKSSLKFSQKRQQSNKYWSGVKYYVNMVIKL